MNPEIAPLVSAARQGDRDAFTKLVELHHKVAHSIAYGILYDTHLAADAVQDAYLKAWLGLDGLREDGKFSAWFSQIVRSKSLDLLRHRKRKVPETAQLDDDLDADDSPGPSEVLERNERAEQILEIFAGLPAEYREILLLKHYEDLSYSDIARLLGTTVRGVDSKLYRARQAMRHPLKQLFDPDGGSP